jgi:hypothetical protein
LSDDKEKRYEKAIVKAKLKFEKADGAYRKNPTDRNLHAKDDAKENLGQAEWNLQKYKIDRADGRR